MAVSSANAQVIWDNDPQMRSLYEKNHPDWTPQQAVDDWWKWAPQAKDYDSPDDYANKRYGRGTNPPGTPPPGTPPPGTGGAPGADSTVWDKEAAKVPAKAMYFWAAKFKDTERQVINGSPGQMEKRPPSRQDFIDGWGKGGGQAVDWVLASGFPNGWPDEATFTEGVSGILVNNPPSGTVGSAYTPTPSLAKDYQDWTKDFQERKFTADEAERKANEAYRQATLAQGQGNQELARQQFAESQRQFDIAQKSRDEANAIQLAGMLGTYNGQPTLALQQMQQNQAQFEKTFGLQYEQFTFQKDQFAKQYGLSEAQVTGMFGGNPTLAMQQFQASKDQFAQNFGLGQANITGWYQGMPTLERETLAMQAARAGNPLAYLAYTRGQPIQNYAGMPPSPWASGAPGPPPTGAPPGGVPAPGATAPPSPAPSLPPGATAPPPGASLPALSRADFEAVGGGRWWDMVQDPAQKAYAEAKIKALYPDLWARMTAPPPGRQMTGGPTGIQTAPGEAREMPGGALRRTLPIGEAREMVGGSLRPPRGAPGGQPPLEMLGGGGRIRPPGDVREMPGGALRPPRPGAPPPMPWALGQIVGGQPLPAYNPTGGTGLRLAGAQAQANESPLERRARMEAYELSGAREEDITAGEERLRRSLGPGLAPSRYRGAPRRWGA